MAESSNLSTTNQPGKEAICFTSGPKGAAFGAGVIHAWLASDREAPFVAAGISMGAVTAAAMQKCYRELDNSTDKESREGQRWSWFRQYLNAVSNNPLEFLWRAIPDPVDFFADKPPVKDLSVRLLSNELRDEAPEARRHHYLLTKFGIWLAGLPVRVSTVASFAVYRVRHKEQYGSALFNWFGLISNGIKMAVGLWWHFLRAPRFLYERSFKDSSSSRNKALFHPLFGWLVWLASLFVLVCPALIFVASLFRHWPLAIVLGFALLPPLLLLGAAFLFGPTRQRLLKHLSKQIDISQAVLSPFELRRVLFGLFKDDQVTPASQASHLLIVCAVLEQTAQVWPKPQVPMVKALSAALAIPGIFPPVRVDASDWENYKVCGGHATLIDGVAVRSNPISAFFDCCHLYPDQAKSLERSSPKDTSLHVVYNVPVVLDGSAATAPGLEHVDIVDSAFAALELEKRRDTRQEVRQTNFLSELELLRREADNKGSNVLSIFADEIAPRREIQFANKWEPTRAESLRVAAQGCRETLETLYRDKIGTSPMPVRCDALLRVVADKRREIIGKNGCGLPEICSSCTGILVHRSRASFSQPPPGVIRSYGQTGTSPQEGKLHEIFPHLKGDRPRIVFLGSGGVFRGAFHIGVIGAMTAARVFPDLVIGASVGALMGGALANLSSTRNETEQIETLQHLAALFLKVDERVALTRTIKNATKQLGIRARNIKLSPAELKRMVADGSQADPGFAATGAPPALIDALSCLFMIPHRRTAEIASQFVAGHITGAINEFLQEVRKETLTSFDIQNALLGTSLLENEARTLLGEDKNRLGKDKNRVDLSHFQPYHAGERGGRNVSFFCTTSFLNARISLLLGRDFLTENPTWDGVFAGFEFERLSSSLRAPQRG